MKLSISCTITLYHFSDWLVNGAFFYQLLSILVNIIINKSSLFFSNDSVVFMLQNCGVYSTQNTYYILTKQINLWLYEILTNCSIYQYQVFNYQDYVPIHAELEVLFNQLKYLFMLIFFNLVYYSTNEKNNTDQETLTCCVVELELFCLYIVCDQKA